MGTGLGENIFLYCITWKMRIKLFKLKPERVIRALDDSVLVWALIVLAAAVFPFCLYLHVLSWPEPWMALTLIAAGLSLDLLFVAAWWLRRPKPRR